MDKGKLIVSLIIFAIAGINLFLSIMSFMEKGKLMNNAYIYASKEEREKMNKKPYYIQTGIVFILFTKDIFIFGLRIILLFILLFVTALFV